MSKPIFCHVVACSTNNVIGLNGQLPWHIPEDLEFFHNITQSKACIMGRKTFESLGKPLSGRQNIILTKNQDFTPPKGVKVFQKLQEAMEFSATPEMLAKHGSEICIIGGGEIYKRSLGLMDRLYVTRIHKEFKGDSFYPEIPSDLFKKVKQVDKNQGLSYSFLVYEKTSQ